MRHRTLLTAAAIIVATTAWAGSAHFIYATDSLDSAGDLVAHWKEAGLGNSPVHYTLTASAESTWQCYTKSSNTPMGAPNGSFSPSATASGTFPPTHNGQITGSLTLEPTPPASSCQGQGLKLCLTAVHYTNVSLTDDTSVPPVPAQPLLDQQGGPFLDTKGRPTNCV